MLELAVVERRVEASARAWSDNQQLRGQIQTWVAGFPETTQIRDELFHVGLRLRVAEAELSEYRGQLQN
eukprot:9420599-Lingulodinium_polyedra.AAC.1